MWISLKDIKSISYKIFQALFVALLVKEAIAYPVVNSSTTECNLIAYKNLPPTIIGLDCIDGFLPRKEMSDYCINKLRHGTINYDSSFIVHSIQECQKISGELLEKFIS